MASVPGVARDVAKGQHAGDREQRIADRGRACDRTSGAARRAANSRGSRPEMTAAIRMPGPGGREQVESCRPPPPCAGAATTGGIFSTRLWRPATGSLATQMPSSKAFDLRDAPEEDEDTEDDPGRPGLDHGLRASRGRPDARARSSTRSFEDQSRGTSAITLAGCQTRKKQRRGKPSRRSRRRRRRARGHGSSRPGTAGWRSDARPRGPLARPRPCRGSPQTPRSARTGR